MSLVDEEEIGHRVKFLSAEEPVFILVQLLAVKISQPTMADMQLFFVDKCQKVKKLQIKYE